MPDVQIDFNTRNIYDNNWIDFFQSGINTLRAELQLPFLERAKANYLSIREAFELSENPFVKRGRKSRLKFSYVLENPDFTDWPPPKLLEFSYNLVAGKEYLEFPLFRRYIDYDYLETETTLDLVPCNARCIPDSHIPGPDCPRDPFDCEMIEGCIRCSERSGKCTANERRSRRKSRRRRSRRRFR